MALNIKNEETHRLARTLARRNRETVTLAVTIALRERLERQEEADLDQANQTARFAQERQTQVNRIA